LPRQVQRLRPVGTGHAYRPRASRLEHCRADQVPEADLERIVTVEHWKGALELRRHAEVHERQRVRRRVTDHVAEMEVVVGLGKGTDVAPDSRGEEGG